MSLIFSIIYRRAAYLILKENNYKLFSATNIIGSIVKNLSILRFKRGVLLF
nr:MAG TPA: hypothetical protein [Caudoviricetes sp.]